METVSFNFCFFFFNYEDILKEKDVKCTDKKSLTNEMLEYFSNYSNHHKSNRNVKQTFCNRGVRTPRMNGRI